MKSYDEQIIGLVKAHQIWRGKCLNMIPSENITSPAVREVTSSDFMHRYLDLDEPFYRGTKFMNEVKSSGERLAEKVFGADFACLKPLSGNTADIAALIALTKSGDKIISIHERNGGYYGFSKGGCAEVLGIKLEYFPFDDYEMNVRTEEAYEKIMKAHPRLIILGASFILFPEPVKELSEAAADIGADVVYDGSHVLGLIAGKCFQDPLREGASLLIGSTHKTFPGPQGGIIVGETEFREKIERACLPMFDNHHVQKVAGIAVTLAEMLSFGEDYAKQIVRNSKKIAKALDDFGIPVKCSHKGYTESHQVLLDIHSSGVIEDVTDRLERANIIVDRGIRIGTQEVTRLGMREREMEQIAEFFKRIIKDREKPEKVAVDVMEMSAEFNEVHFCFKRRGFAPSLL
ncbi:MAG: serine hydroxymethyltransferase [Candidatus Bathyarchaeota archaeon]|nr:serine hydroxymethyltransferase [Candidatus Bathyarchaeota archaeon]